jgi:acyl-CoA synthetase (NDP forming)
VLTQPESVRLIDNRIPAYGSPEAAVRALARAAGYGAWRAAPRGHVPALPDVRTADARALVRTPGWLGPAAYLTRTRPDLDVLHDLLLRVSRLADDLPEVTELDLSPVIARPHEVFATDARIKLAPCLPQDPFLRRLR